MNHRPWLVQVDRWNRRHPNLDAAINALLLLAWVALWLTLAAALS